MEFRHAARTPKRSIAAALNRRSSPIWTCRYKGPQHGSARVHFGRSWPRFPMQCTCVRPVLLAEHVGVDQAGDGRFVGHDADPAGAALGPGYLRGATGTTVHSRPSRAGPTGWSCAGAHCNRPRRRPRSPWRPFFDSRDVAGIEPKISPVAVDRAFQEALQSFIDLLAEPRSLALEDPGHAHRTDQVIRRAGWA